MWPLGTGNVASVTEGPNPPFFLKTLFIFRERGREGEREGEKYHCVVSSHMLTGDPACNPGMYPDWELNWRPFGSQADTESTEPHQLGQHLHFHLILLHKVKNLMFELK